MNIYGVYNPGEVYLCSIPHGTGHEILKDRPAVVVSDKDFNDANGVVWVVMCSASDHDGRANCVPVSGLERESWAICGQLFAVDKSRLGRFICKVRDLELWGIATCIKAHLPRETDEETARWKQPPPYIERARQTELEKARVERDTYKNMYESLLNRIFAGGGYSK